MADRMNKGKKASVAKVGIIYTLSNLVIRGMAFITTPIFTRLLTKSEYGEFSNISSWAHIIAIIVTLQLYVSIVRAKYDYENELDKYLSSILLLGNLITVAWYVVFEVNSTWFETLLKMDKPYIRLIFVYAFFSPAMQILTFKNRICCNYQKVVFFTWITLFVSTLGSVVLVLAMQDRLMGRTIGNYFLIAIVDAGLWLYILIKGKGICLQHWKYALKFSVPLIPHELAGTLLAMSDRIIIKRLCGAEDAALYSLAYTISSIANVLLTSLNQAWQPWLYDHIRDKKLSDIRKYTIPYTIVFAAGCTFIMLIGPEIVLIFGGKAYIPAKYVIPPVCYGTMLQFVYTLYANIEFYEKKTGWISAATMMAAFANIVLNFIAIPIFGYISAAYTTAIGFLLMVIFHYYVVNKKTEYGHVYNEKILIVIMTVMLFVMIGANFLYDYLVIRYLVVLGFVLTATIGAIKNKKFIIGVLDKKIAKNK
ncbi:lipopolysaccharide biosynthesis protein [Butyrivibrio sp. YAB3001]|uniref:lipopolysaccharide biosynthesis protein n=1 Tax=Butyrivibrio sp. YAB3001 TaxID=1520812 RepID=UPI0008F63B93|nr:oligosaccharide flippase family protein [Butyrivibrio sp. YAB3001]SFC23123.1 Membrane protein involved in the export of O-antigen and teichoic acid [Butyrivibrio sp. YAB3001]